MVDDEAIVVSLQPFGTEHRFETPSAAASWFDSERSAWSALEALPTNSIARGQIVQPLLSALDQLRSMAIQIHNAQESQRPALRHQLINQTTSRYSSRQLIPSASPQGQFLLQLAQQSPPLAADAYRYFSGLGGPGLQLPWIPGILDAHLFTRGISTESAAATLSALQSIQADYAQLLTSAQSQLAEFAVARQQLDASSAESRQTNAMAFAALVESSKTTLEDLTATYDRKLALRKPVEYLKSQATRHDSQAVMFAILAAVISLPAVAAIVFLASSLAPDNFSIQSLTTPRFLVFMVVSSVLIWLIRIVVRVMLSHVHLGTDTKERATMIEAYLSLMREGHALNEADRSLILSAIFRPAATGIVKEDSAPASMLEWVTRQMAK